MTTTRAGSPSARLRSRLRRRPFTHHNRLAAAVVAVNAVAAFGMGHGQALSGQVLSGQALSDLVLANVALAVLIRQQHVVNLLFRLATSAPTTWPLGVRWALGKVYHFGGLHVGAAVCATAWFAVLAWVLAEPLTWAILALLVGMVVSAVPRLRARWHDAFERVHRFAGWTVLVLFAVHSCGQPGFVGSWSSWVFLLVVVSVALPWTRLRRVPVRIVRPSGHVALLSFDHGVTPFAGSSTAVSRHPLLEWHSFANVPTPGRSGFRLTVSRAGDWTGALIDDLPTHLWVKGVPTAGVGNIDKLFTGVVWVATGSGIGPCLPHLLARGTPARLVWSTRSPRETYGDDLVDEILAAQPDALVWDTARDGKPDLVDLALRAHREFGAEAVICISNKRTTWQVVEGLEARGVPAFGAIWDS
ncbi:hypothetical protein ACFV4N_14955 [Actinosynnema sp. NPDC059797]